MRELLPVLDHENKVLHWRCSDCDWTFATSDAADAVQTTGLSFRTHQCAPKRQAKRVDEITPGLSVRRFR